MKAFFNFIVMENIELPLPILEKGFSKCSPETSVSAPQSPRDVNEVRAESLHDPGIHVVSDGPGGPSRQGDPGI